jgi:hypothetical protein
MLRRLLPAAVLAALVIAAPASARTIDASRPVLLISGAESDAPRDCGQTWKPLDAWLAEDSFNIAGKRVKFTGDRRTVTFEGVDKNCDQNIPNVPGEGVVGQARALAGYISAAYTKKDIAIDAVAHGTGGLALRYAIAKQGTPGWPALRVEDVVTLGTPHAGSKTIAEECSRPVCLQMDADAPANAALWRELGSEPFQNPQGEGGTEWSVIGSAKDELAPPATATGMAASHKSYYKETRSQRIDHEGLLKDTREEWGAAIVYSHPNRENIEWNKGPHVGRRVANSLVYGSTVTTGGANGNRPGCSGYNADAKGPTSALSGNLFSWEGTEGDVSFVKVGVIEAYAACFKKVGDQRYESEAVVRINGLDVFPAPGEKVAIDVEKLLVSSEKATVRLPKEARIGSIPVPLQVNTALAWRIPRTGGAVRGDEEDILKVSGGGRVGGLKLKGGFNVAMEQGKVTLKVDVGLPGFFSARLPSERAVKQCANGEDDDEDGKTDLADKEDCENADDFYENPADGPGLAVTVSSTNDAGIKLDRIAGELEGSVSLGRLTIDGGVRFSYDWAKDTWSAGVTAALPMPGNPTVRADVSFVGGRFKSLDASLDDINRGPLGSTGLFLQRVALGVATDPFKLTIGTGLSLGPRWTSATRGSITLWRADGDLSVGSESSSLSGKLSILGEEWGSGKLEWKYGNGVTVQAGIRKKKEFASKKVPGVERKVSGKITMDIQGQLDGSYDGKSFDASMTARACFSASLEIYSVRRSIDSTCLVDAVSRMSIVETQMAFSACGGIDIGVWEGKIGGGIRSRIVGNDVETTSDMMAGACDVDRWHETAAGSQTRAPGEFTLGSAPAAMVAVRGEAAPPRIAVHGPDGEELAAPATATGVVRSGRFALVHFAADATTYVVIGRPTPGRWRIEAMPDSSPVVAIETADALPEAEVRGTLRRVRRGSARRELRYRVKPIEGQRVTLVELGRDVRRTLGRARDGRGVRRFRPAFGPGGPRRIVAMVSQRGLPRTEITVARFRAEAPRPLGRPRTVRLRRRGARLTVRWAPVAGAAGYVAYVRTADGRAIRNDVDAVRRPSLTVRRLLGARGVRIELRALRQDGRVGPATRIAGGRARRR